MGQGAVNAASSYQTQTEREPAATLVCQHKPVLASRMSPSTSAEWSWQRRRVTNAARPDTVVRRGRVAIIPVALDNKSGKEHPFIQVQRSSRTVRLCTTRADAERSCIQSVRPRHTHSVAATLWFAQRLQLAASLFLQVHFAELHRLHRNAWRTLFRTSMMCFRPHSEGE
ncbi:hypothetical protein B0H17DRAFT_1135561 [Mycena rosella]|uniref:Uncharacterized protein n=1 Tax=Mycena rosella TaxID=1033263 RepID=A0AAD7GH15_MYCRO|nr:hypothetical protein B0H17DRAFT_1135561 [Mycena rosella]